jgi:small subunit ribosomal protein S20
MPNTVSAERRARQSARRHISNSSVKNRLKTIEKRYLATVKAGKKDDAEKAFREVSSAFDKAAKTGVIHAGKASRKKSRLAAHLQTATAA